ncbi:hypothetical protein [Novosphingobium pokkalii]|uniref:Uncharacterized protein n=1 Tax=Novosphingobium pokkalii TaxID=1770194 RepID=A0ABV7V7F9_9SPHN|nr:hypothetical protein [Novosphingobium pokkalii]GHC99743.1 hypothetical protein GCM10019060_32680 [Novosphingobium pokkalii]
MHTIKIGHTGHPLASFADYDGYVEVTPKHGGTVMGVDGRLSVWGEPWLVYWRGGTQKSLRDWTQIIVTRLHDQSNVISGQICRNLGVKAERDGVSFYVWPDR